MIWSTCYSQWMQKSAKTIFLVIIFGTVSKTLTSELADWKRVQVCNKHLCNQHFNTFQLTMSPCKTGICSSWFIRPRWFIRYAHKCTLVSWWNVLPQNSITKLSIHRWVSCAWSWWVKLFDKAWGNALIGHKSEEINAGLASWIGEHESGRRRTFLKSMSYAGQNADSVSKDDSSSSAIQDSPYHIIKCLNCSPTSTELKVFPRFIVVGGHTC